MEKSKREAIMNAATFDQLLDAEYGKIGSAERDQFEMDAAVFRQKVTVA